MKNLYIASVFASVAVLASCATPKTLVLSTPAVSMTDTSFEAGRHFASTQEVKSRFCVGDDAISSSKDESNIGFMDELVLRAQKESGARYISNAQFFAQGNCMLLEGTAMK
jgi:hypothetical protein